MILERIMLLFVSTSLLFACAEIEKKTGGVSTVISSEISEPPTSQKAAAITPEFTAPDNLPDGIWFDRKTGLMWQKCPEGQVFDKNSAKCDGSSHQRPLDRAIKAAYNNKYAGYNDWRLPTHSDFLAFKNNAIVFTTVDKFQAPRFRPNYLASGAAFPAALWTSEKLIRSKKAYASKACFPYVQGIGACGSSYTVAGKDMIFGTANTGESWAEDFILVRDGKPNAIWNDALLSIGIDPAVSKASLSTNDSSKQLAQTTPPPANSEFIQPPYPSCRPYAGLLDNKDGTLTDPRSGLIWSRCDLGTRFVKGKGCIGKQKKYSWVNAMKTAREFNQGGHKDWRLPTIEEVESITDSDSNCSRYGEYHKTGTAAVDLRMLVQEYYESGHYINVLGVFYDRGWGGSNRVRTQPLRSGYAPMNHNGEDINTGSSLTRLVRQSSANDENAGLSKRLYIKYIDEVDAKADQERRQRNAEEDARIAAEKAKNRRLNAAKE